MNCVHTSTKTQFTFNRILNQWEKIHKNKVKEKLFPFIFIFPRLFSLVFQIRLIVYSDAFFNTNFSIYISLRTRSDVRCCATWDLTRNMLSLCNIYSMFYCILIDKNRCCCSFHDFLFFTFIQRLVKLFESLPNLRSNGIRKSIKRKNWLQLMKLTFLRNISNFRISVHR